MTLYLIYLIQSNPSYLKKSIKQKAFLLHGSNGTFLVKIDCFHFNLHPLWHALFDVCHLSLVDQLFGQNTGQAGLTAAVSLLVEESRDVSVTNAI